MSLDDYGIGFDSVSDAEFTNEWLARVHPFHRALRQFPDRWFTVPDDAEFLTRPGTGRGVELVVYFAAWPSGPPVTRRLAGGHTWVKLVSADG